MRIERFAKVLVPLGAFILVSVSPCLAAESPADILSKIIGQIKAESNASPVVEYVDWNKAFSETSEMQRKGMNITSPDAMKTFYRDVLKNPADLMKKQFEAKLATVPETERPVLERSLQRMEEMMKQKETEMKAKIAATEYEVGKEEISGDTATVQLKQTYNGETKTENVQFVKKDDKWLLPSVGAMGNKKGPGAPAATPSAPPVAPSTATAP